MKYTLFALFILFIGCGPVEDCIDNAKHCAPQQESASSDEKEEVENVKLELPEEEKVEVEENRAPRLHILDMAHVSPRRVWEDFYELEAAAFVYFAEPVEIDEFIIHHIGSGVIEIEVNEEFFFKVYPEDTNLVDITRTLRHLGEVWSIRVDTYLPIYLDGFVRPL